MADLTTATKVKAYLQITASTWDSLLATLVTAVSADIERRCGRTFGAATYSEWHSGNRQRTLQLKHYPVIYVDRVATGHANAISVSTTGFVRATIQVYADGVRLYSMNSAGTAVETTTGLTFVACPTVSLLATAIDAVSGWTATLVDDGPADELCPLGALDVTSTTEYLTHTDDPAGFTIDADNGVIAYQTSSDWPDDSAPLRMRGGFKNWFVRYRAGYATIPTDLEQIANEIVSEVFRAGTRDQSIKSESLGDYSYTLADIHTSVTSRLTRLSPWIDVPVGGAR